MEAQQGRGSWFLVIPILTGLGLIGSGAAWWIAVQQGGTATGAWARLQFQTTCPIETRAAMAARLADYGLENRFLSEDVVLEVQTPGSPDDLEHLPRALARPGQFEVWRNGTLHTTRFKDAGMQLTFTGVAVTLVNLDESIDPDGVEVRIDGAPVELEGINGPELQISTPAKTSHEALREATDRVVAIRHPIPCVVEVVKAEWME